MVIFACEGAGADSLGVDAASGRCGALPGARVMIVPCTGWIHSLSVERALRRGARGVIIAGCPPGACRFREGDLLLTERLAGTREPEFRSDKADASLIRSVHASTSMRSSSRARSRPSTEARRAREPARAGQVADACS